LLQHGIRAVLTMLVCSPLVLAQTTVKQLGSGLYAYISDNDSSANSTFLVEESGILVVDTGLNNDEGAKLLHAIRQVSGAPVKYIVNTHYHPDHQGGNEIVGPAAVVISTDYTRQRTLELMKDSKMAQFHFHSADLTFQHQVTLHLGSSVAEIYFPGKAHTAGDALVYFPQQHAIAMGDLFLNNSSPAMDDGSALNWIQALDHALELPLNSAVPGHFGVGRKADLKRFRDYLNDLYSQVQSLRQKGETVEQVRHDVHMEKYSDFRQYPKFEATFADNAATIYQQMEAHSK
jgi:cyclase